MIRVAMRSSASLNSAMRICQVRWALREVFWLLRFSKEGSFALLVFPENGRFRLVPEKVPPIPVVQGAFAVAVLSGFDLGSALSLETQASPSTGS
jgi:hypothetical protein